MANPDRPFARTTTLNRFKQPLFIVGIAIAFAATLMLALLPGLTGAALSAVALLIFGGAQVLLTLDRLGPIASLRLGGRTQQQQTRVRRLALTAMVVTFATVVLGTLTTSLGATYACPEWPICSATNELSQLVLVHRGLAGAATLLVLVLGSLVWRRYSEPLVRTAVGWAIGLLMTQNVLGLFQVLALNSGQALPSQITRLGHLGLGAAAWGAVVVLGITLLRLPMPAAEEPVAKPDNNERTWKAVLKDYVSLTKPGVISLLILTTITTMYITPTDAPSLTLIWWTFLGGWLMASGAHAVNCYMDRDIDINMGRTARRPIPSGRIPAWHALVLGIVLGVVAFAILTVFVNLAAALLSLAGYFYYVLIYTKWLKRNSPSNIVIGGGAGAFPPMVGWAAMTGSVGWEALLLWLIVFYWTPPHFWALALIREKDYARAKVPMLPVVAGERETKRQIILYSIQMIVLTILPTPLGMLGLPYLAMALVLGAIFMYYAIKLRYSTVVSTAWGLYKFSLLYLALLFAAMVIDRQLFG
jgi:protoheme IX farnesyltransferase